MRNISILSSLVFFIIINLSTFNSASSQDINYARKVMDTLSSASMYGRGYVNEGCAIAADYITSEMSKHGLKSFNNSYKQTFKVDVMAYPKEISFSINGEKLKVGHDFIVMTGSPSTEGFYDFEVIDSTYFKNTRKLLKLKKKGLSNTLVAFNREVLKGKKRNIADSLLKANFIDCAGFVLLTKNERMLLSVRPPAKTFAQPVITMLSKLMPAEEKKASLRFELENLKEYPVSNVIGYIPGSTQPDSFVVITAHYDHLGMLGPQVYFPGANDNASGTAMILDLASHYSKESNRLPYSIAIMAFAGEEIGLMGSLYYVDNPLFDLKKIKFLLNLDMVGTGSQGITMVNSLTFPDHFKKMETINNEKKYLSSVNQRGESCNSDHCPFYLNGVPAVFIYSMGKEHSEYHNVYDLPERVPLTEYEDIFKLMRDFINTL